MFTAVYLARGFTQLLDVERLLTGGYLGSSSSSSSSSGQDLADDAAGGSTCGNYRGGSSTIHSSTGSGTAAKASTSCVEAAVDSDTLILRIDGEQDIDLDEVR